MLRKIQSIKPSILPFVTKHKISILKAVLLIIVILFFLYITLFSGNISHESSSLEFLNDAPLERLDGSKNTFLAGELWKEKACVVMAVRRAG